MMCFLRVFDYLFMDIDLLILLSYLLNVIDFTVALLRVFVVCMFVFF